MNQLKTPVAFIVFNRPETTRRVFTAIASARPVHLLLIADGPRMNRVGETQRCEEVRKIISAVDWPCRVETNFSDENLGCRRRMISGLNWVFSRVEQAIILEDDCLPAPSFFPFCTEMLEKYRNSPQVGIISGFNPLRGPFPFDHSYYFTKMVSIWGWATWRRCWQEYDEHLVKWPEVKKGGLLNQLFREKRYADYWTQTFDAMHDGTGPNAWGYQMVYTSFVRHWLSVAPVSNLIQNIGFGEDATHTTRADPGLVIAARGLEFPLVHPSSINEWPNHAREMQRRFYSPSLWFRLRSPNLWPRVRRRIIRTLRQRIQIQRRATS